MKQVDWQNAIMRARNKQELNAVQLDLSVHFRVTPFISKNASKKYADWIGLLDTAKLKKKDGFIQYKTEHEKGVYVPPPILFDTGSAYEWLLGRIDSKVLSFNCGRKADKWHVATTSDADTYFAHKYMAAALVAAFIPMLK